MCCIYKYRNRNKIARCRLTLRKHSIFVFIFIFWPHHVDCGILVFRPGLAPGGSSLVVQWLRLHSPNAGGRSSIPGQGTRSHTLQLRVWVPQLKLPRAASKAWCSRINKYIKYIYFKWLEPVPSAVKTQSHNHWTAREFPEQYFLKYGIFTNQIWMFKVKGIVWVTFSENKSHPGNKAIPRLHSLSVSL